MILFSIAYMGISGNMGMLSSLIIIFDFCLFFHHSVLLLFVYEYDQIP